MQYSKAKETEAISKVKITKEIPKAKKSLDDTKLKKMRGNGDKSPTVDTKEILVCVGFLIVYSNGQTYHQAIWFYNSVQECGMRAILNTT